MRIGGKGNYNGDKVGRNWEEGGGTGRRGEGSYNGDKVEELGGAGGWGILIRIY